MKEECERGQPPHAMSNQPAARSKDEGAEQTTRTIAARSAAKRAVGPGLPATVPCDKAMEVAQVIFGDGGASPRTEMVDVPHQHLLARPTNERTAVRPQHGTWT